MLLMTCSHYEQKVYETPERRSNSSAHLSVCRVRSLVVTGLIIQLIYNVLTASAELVAADINQEWGEAI